MSYPTYYESFNYQKMLHDYPIGDSFLKQYQGMSRAELEKIQNERFINIMERAWEIPFYQRLWSKAGIHRSTIKSINDITKLPIFSKKDIMENIEENPPIGDFSGLESIPKDQRPPCIFHTTSGTTGTPQPLFFGAKSREIQSLLVARGYRLMGLKPGSVMQSCYGHGMTNGGHYIREAVTHYTNALYLSAGTGVETRSTHQVKLMNDYGVTVLVGFSDYIKKLADVARSEGLIPGEDIKIQMIIGHLGGRKSRNALYEAWGGDKNNLQLFDWYGVGDTGAIAAEAIDQDGMYVWEDAQFLEVLSTENNKPVKEGEAGNMIVTCLYKDDVYPIIRFNTCDITQEIPGDNQLKIPFKRIKGFLGRSDNMIKLRGINVYPTSVGAILEEETCFIDEYVCCVDYDKTGNENITVIAEINAEKSQYSHIKATMENKLKSNIGVHINVEPCAKGETATLTEIEHRQKPKRLVDLRTQ